MVKAAGGRLEPIVEELATVGADCITFLRQLLGTEGYASPEFDGSRMHAQILLMLLETTVHSPTDSEVP